MKFLTKTIQHSLLTFHLLDVELNPFGRRLSPFICLVREVFLFGEGVLTGGGDMSLSAEFYNNEDKTML